MWLPLTFLVKYLYSNVLFYLYLLLMCVLQLVVVATIYLFTLPYVSTSLNYFILIVLLPFSLFWVIFFSFMSFK